MLSQKQHFHHRHEDAWTATVKVAAVVTPPHFHKNLFLLITVAMVTEYQQQNTLNSVAVLQKGSD